MKEIEKRSQKEDTNGKRNCCTIKQEWMEGRKEERRENREEEWMFGRKC